jgi:hypothetical protein
VLEVLGVVQVVIPSVHEALISNSSTAKVCLCVWGVGVGVGGKSSL